MPHPNFHPDDRDSASTSVETLTHPDFYKRFIINSADDHRLVLASALPADLYPGVYLALEVDDDGIPVPEPVSQPVGVMRLPEAEGYQENASQYLPFTEPEKAMLHHKHFQIGGAEISAGLYSADTDSFTPAFDAQGMQKITGGKWGDGHILSATRPAGENPTLANVMEVAYGIAARDWVPRNNHGGDTELNPIVARSRRYVPLADIAAKKAVDAFYRLGLIGFSQQPRQPFEDVPLYQEVARIIQADDVWERMKWQSNYKQNGPHPENYLQQLKEAALHIEDGQHWPSHFGMMRMLADLVEAQITPIAEDIISNHAEDIKALEAERQARRAEQKELDAIERAERLARRAEGKDQIRKWLGEL